VLHFALQVPGLETSFNSNNNGASNIVTLAVVYMDTQPL
jgi:hypothetical protein